MTSLFVPPDVYETTSPTGRWFEQFKTLAFARPQDPDAMDRLFQDVDALPQGLDSPMPNGIPPLHIAIDHHRGERVVQRLLANGANPNVLDEQGRTPLLRWASAPIRPMATMTLLVQHGADAALRSPNGEAPLDKMVSEALLDDEIPAMTGVTALLDAGARWDVLSMTSRGSPPETLWDVVMRQDNAWEAVQQAFRAAEVQRLRAVLPSSTEDVARAPRRL